MFRSQQYLFDIGPDQFLLVRLDGEMTVIALQSDAISQRQSQQSGFTTGPWLVEPQAWQWQGIVYLRIQSQQGSVWLQVGGGQMGFGSPAPQMAVPLPSRAMSGPPRAKSVESSMPPMQPMPPIQPMQPLQPMEMQMGNMSMSMGGRVSERSQSQEPTDLRLENLRLREENLRLREEIFALREQLRAQERAN